MATIEQVPPTSPDVDVVSPLNSLLARAYSINWETVFYIGVFVVAVLTRLVNLGDRVASHDESLHMEYSYNLYKRGDFQHTPLMHGPVLFHAVAFMYLLFGDSDFTARLYPAILGIIMVMMPKILFERWLGKFGAMVSSVLILISPMLLYHARYIREDTPSIFFTLIMVYAVFCYLDGARPRQGRYLIMLSAAMLLSLASKEVGFMYVGIFGLALTIFWVFQMVQHHRSLDFIGLRGKSLHKLLLTGLIVGTIAGLGMIAILRIVQPENIFKTTPVVTQTDQSGQGNQTQGQASQTTVDQELLSRLITWSTLLALTLVLAVMVTALIRFSGLPRLPWADLAIIFITAVIWCLLFVVLEEKLRKAPNVSAETSVAKEINNVWIALTWVIGLISIGFILLLRFATPFFQNMKRYPVFDVLIVMGSLILPWLSAFPLFFAGYPLDGSTLNQDVIVAGILAIIPFIAVAVTAGLCWDPLLWLACVATFYSIFAFFYTTIFTNIMGIATGLVQSLGYWLAQQGVQRGSQPQYYYLLVELPVYEYLPVIGALVAGIAGLSRLWRFRAERFAAADAAKYVPLGTTDPASADASSDPSSGPVSISQDPAQTQLNATVPLPVPEPPAESVESIPPADLLAAQGSAQSEYGQANLGSMPPPEPELIPDPVPEVERLERPSFLLFAGFWAVMILMAFTIAGEKMPWLTTHLTTPLILITGWYLGTLLEKVEWGSFWKQGWALIVLTPILMIALANAIGSFLLSNRPFSGLTSDQLLSTFTWMGAVLIVALVGYTIIRIAMRVGVSQFVHITVLGVFVLLGVLTFRTAWMAAYINYDYATEFLVYAHGAPANKIVMNVIQEVSKRTTDGMGAKVAYDNLVSWPGSWYFRDYPNARFLGDVTGATDLDTYVAIVVGDAHAQTVEAQLGDKFYKYDYIRMWWPMQDYFDLTPKRVETALSDPNIRQGLWDIWWNRDYTAYGKATGKNFDVSQWPVADRMTFFIRKDVAAQIWDFGTGGAKVNPLPEDPFKALSCPTCAASAIFTTQIDQNSQLNRPHGIAVAPNGNIYVIDSQNARVVVFDQNGNVVSQFGVPSTDEQNPADGSLREPWGIAVGKDGAVYVADTWNHRVEVFDSSGKFLRKWGKFEQVTPGQQGAVDGFWGPRDIAVDDQNHVYVADTGNKRIRVYDNTGRFLYDIGQGGAAPGQLNEPVGLALNVKANEIFVADTWNKRINVYSLTGGFLRSWAVQAWSSTTESGSRPYLALDNTGTRLLVTDPDVARVLVFDLNGQPVLSFGTLGSAAPFGNNQFLTLGGITVGPTGQIYLVDAGSGRIAHFTPEALPGYLPPVSVRPDQGSSSPPPGNQSPTPQDF